MNSCPHRIIIVLLLLLACQTVSSQYLYDRSNMTIGKVESDGYVKDRSNMNLGRIKPDGYVLDRSNMTIGRAKGVPISYVAVFFFFHLFDE